jgi:hypothetical protein
MIAGGLTSIVGSYGLMKKTKVKLQAGQVSQDPLTSDEKKKAYAFAIMNPLWAGIIFYYGWKKSFPVKAKNANDISLIAFGLWLLSSFMFGWPLSLFA